MVISPKEVSKLFEKTHSLELSFVSYDVIEAIKQRASKACQSLVLKPKSLPNGGVIEEHIPLAFESLTWALTGHETSTHFESAIFNDENVQENLTLIEKLCKRNPKRFLSIVDEWKNIVIKSANDLYRQGKSDNLVIFEIGNRFYLESEAANRLIITLKSQGLLH